MFDTQFDGLFGPQPEFLHPEPQYPVYVGDPAPGWRWRWNPVVGRYEQTPLTTVGSHTTMNLMPKLQVIEYTECQSALVSSSLETIWWNANTERLTVRFVHGGLYSYDDVDQALFQEFMAAESLGRFFAKTFGKDRVRTEPWPGEKHDEMNVTFKKVDEGKLIEFVVHYEETVTGTVAIKAKDVAQAIERFNAEGDAAHPRVVTGVFIPVDSGSFS